MENMCHLMAKLKVRWKLGFQDTTSEAVGCHTLESRAAMTVSNMSDTGSISQSCWTHRNDCFITMRRYYFSSQFASVQILHAHSSHNYVLNSWHRKCLVCVSDHNSTYTCSTDQMNATTASSTSISYYSDSWVSSVVTIFARSAGRYCMINPIRFSF